MVLLVLVLLLGQEGSVVAHHHAARGRVARVDDADGSVLILLASCTSNDCYKSQNDDDSCLCPLESRDALLVLGHHLGRALLQRLDAVPLHGAAGGDHLVLLSLERLDHEHRPVETLAPALLLVYTQQYFS